jgi:hypothetical protein
VIQTNRTYEITAGGVSRRKELLKVAQRDSRLDCHVARTEVRIGKVVLNDIADTREQLVCMKRGIFWIGRVPVSRLDKALRRGITRKNIQRRKHVPGIISFNQTVFLRILAI